MSHNVWRALIVSIRLGMAALLAAVIGISAPAIGIADGISTPPPVVQESEGIVGWITSTANAVKQSAQDKFQSVTDPDRKIAVLTEKLLIANQDNARLRTDLAVKEVRIQVRAQDLERLRRAASDINLLAVTGRLQYLVEALPSSDDAPTNLVPGE